MSWTRVFLWAGARRGASKITPHRGPLTYIKQVSTPLGPADWSSSDHVAELGTVFGSFQGAGVSEKGVHVSFMKIHSKRPDQLLNHPLPLLHLALPERPRLLLRSESIITNEWGLWGLAYSLISSCPLHCLCFWASRLGHPYWWRIQSGSIRLVHSPVLVGPSWRLHPGFAAIRPSRRAGKASGGASGAGEGCLSEPARRRGAAWSGMWRAHLPGPAQVRRLRAAAVFPGRGERLAGRVVKTPGVKGTQKKCRVGREGQSWAPPWPLGRRSAFSAGVRPLERALGWATSKKSNCTIIPGDGTSQRKIETHRLTFGSSWLWWLKEWAVTEFLAQGKLLYSTGHSLPLLPQRRELGGRIPLEGGKETPWAGHWCLSKKIMEKRKVMPPCLLLPSPKAHGPARPVCQGPRGMGLA